jgi:ribokinase
MTIIVLGGINEDIVVSVADLPRRGETITANGVSHCAGGKGLNQAIGAARQGSTVRMLGAVGNDAAGAFLMDVMAREAIDTSAIAVLETHSSGQAYITLTASADNTIIVNAGANTAFGATQVAETNIEAGVFLTQFEATLGAIEALFTSPQGRAGTRILNAAPALPEGRPLLALADIVILNETELQVFADLPEIPEAEADIVTAAKKMAARADQTVIVTLGSLGCIAVSGDDITRIPGFRMDAIDTIGAGDCFCGVLAAALDGGADLASAMRRANAAAALSVTRAGAGEATPSHDEVDVLLNRHSPESAPQ